MSRFRRDDRRSYGFFQSSDTYYHGTDAPDSGVVAADTGTAQMPETQGFTTGTTIQALGTVTETDGLAWILTTDEIPPGPSSWYDTILHHVLQ